MEYRCYILGDTIAEPGALLRRLLFDPFPEAEQRALTHRSLLQVRAEETKNAAAAAAAAGGSGRASAMAVSVPELNAPRTGAVTLPNPSMPSVDVTVQFGVITEPRELERVMLGHYASSASVAGGGGRSPRRRTTSPGSSSGRDGGGGGGGVNGGASSEVSSVTHHSVAATGLALRSPPHALVLVYNPFSLSSVLRLRVEWAHVLRGLRQQRQAQLDYLHAHQQQQQLHQSDSSVFLPRNTSTTSLMGSLAHPGHGKGNVAGTAATAAAMFATSPTAGSPLSPAFPVDVVEGFPPVLLVGARMELMREAMEATPSIRLPSAREVAEVAQGLQAPVYLEVGTNWDDTVDVLRAVIARGCMGELAAAPAVTFDAAYQARQSTIARAMEEVQASPGEEEDEEPEDGARCSAGANGSLVRPPVVTLLGPHGAAVHAATAEDGEHEETSAFARLDRHEAGAPPPPGATAADDSDATSPSSRPSSRASSRHSSGARSDTGRRRRSPLRGRELRRHLVHALAPLCVPPTRAAAAPAVTSTWTSRRHPRTGRVFYVERATGKSQYARPADYDGPPAPPPPDGGAEQSTTLPPPSTAAGGASRKTSDSRAAAEAASSRNPAAAAVERTSRAEDEHSSATAPAASPAAAHPGTPRESGAAAAPTEAGMPSLQEEVGAWRHRQQVQLRRARVRQLERLVAQVRAQADRLRAQSEANAELRQRVVALRADLDATEQSFLAGVAEQNAQLAAETMQVTQAMEELIAAPAPQRTPSDSRAEVASTAHDAHHRSAVPVTCLPAETQRADAAVQEAVAALRDALHRRDAQADAVAQLQLRKVRVAQRMEAAAAELTTLTVRLAELDATRTPLEARLHELEAEEARLRERLAGCEAARAAEERQRVAALEERVAAQRATEQCVRALDAQRDVVAAAQDRFAAVLRAFHVPPRTKRAVLLEERERLRLALEAATAQCARALLEGADQLGTASGLARDLRGAAAQLQSARTRHERRLRDQLAAAEAAQARVVLARYTPQPVGPRGDSDNVLTDELAELNVAACAEAHRAWQAHDERVTLPLLKRVEGAVRELDAVMQEAQEHSGGGRAASSAAMTPLPLMWLGEEVKSISQAVCEACAEPQYALAQHCARADATARSRPDTHATDAGQSSPAMPLPPVTGNADAVSHALWRTCDGVLTRMPRLSPQFTSLYTSVRGV